MEKCNVNPFSDVCNFFGMNNAGILYVAKGTPEKCDVLFYDGEAVKDAHLKKCRVKGTEVSIVEMKDERDFEGRTIYHAPHPKLRISNSGRKAIKGHNHFAGFLVGDVVFRSGLNIYYACTCENCKKEGGDGINVMNPQQMVDHYNKHHH